MKEILWKEAEELLLSLLSFQFLMCSLLQGASGVV